MTSFSNESPTAYCEDRTRHQLADDKEVGIWMSRWPFMEKILNRSLEMKHIYREICDRFGYPPQRGGNPAVLLILEAIWDSGKLFTREEISKKREVRKELFTLRDEIISLSGKLSNSMARQRELLECEDFDPGGYASLIDLVVLAGKNNGLFDNHVREELQGLDREFDLKYWPSPEQLVDAIGVFEESRPSPVQGYIPESVIDGRSNDFKDFVLSFDADLDETHQIPCDFRFSDNAVASLANVVLDLPDNKVVTNDNVRVIRQRRKDGAYS